MRCRALAALGLLSLVATACQGSSNASTSSSSADIVIASDMPHAAFLDVVPLEQAVRLAIAQQGNIAGFKLGYMPLDDSLGATANQAMGVQNINAMIADPRVLGMIGPSTSNVAYTEIPAASAGNLAMLSPSNTNVCLTVPAPYCADNLRLLRPNGHNTYFRIAAPDIAEGTAMGRYAANVLKVRRAAAFSEWHNAGPLIIDAFAAELAKAGGQVVLRADLESGTTAFTSFLAQAKADGVDAIYAVTGTDDDHVCVARAQMLSLSITAKFLVTDGAFSDQCVSDAVGGAEGVLMTFSEVDLTFSSDAAAKEVVRAYRQAFPQTSRFPEYTFAAYDCARILIEAIKQAIQANGGRIPSRPEVVKALAAVHFAGVTGVYSFDENGDATSPLMAVYEVQKGKWVYLQKVSAGVVPS